jgi:hypothetical protein
MQITCVGVRKMKVVIERGDIVYIHSMKTQGKVIKLNFNKRSALVEIILAYSRKTGIRVTKLETVSLNDVEKVLRKRKVHGI